MLSKLRRLISSVLIVVLLTVSLVFTSPANAYAGLPIDLNTVTDTLKNISSNADEVKEIAQKLLSNKFLMRDAKQFLSASPDLICSAYIDMQNNGNSSRWDAILKGGTAAATVTQAAMSASAAGAGSLTGYAGIAAAVSQLGLGGLTQAAAGFLGSNAVGAAATAVVTSTVGGPVAMAALVTVGLAGTAYVGAEVTSLVAHNLGDWAASSCN
jgi:hypothetical protein